MGSLTLFEGQRKRGRQIHVSIVESLYVQLFKGTSTSFNSTVQLLLWCHYRAQFGIRVLFGKTLLPPFPHFFHRSEKMSPQLLWSPNIRLVSTPLFDVTDKVKEVAVMGQCVWHAPCGHVATGPEHWFWRKCRRVWNLTVCTAEVAGLRSHAHKSWLSKKASVPISNVELEWLV